MDATTLSGAIVFIDPRVSNLQELVDGAQPGERVLVLDANSDGVQ